MLAAAANIATVVRYEQVETAEYAGMFKWFEEATFPDPAGARETLRRMSLGLYPGVIKAAMATFDVVESIAVSRTRVCAAGGIHALTRIQVAGCLKHLLTPARFIRTVC